MLTATGWSVCLGWDFPFSRATSTASWNPVGKVGGAGTWGGVKESGVGGVGVRGGVGEKEVWDGM